MKKLYPQKIVFLFVLFTGLNLSIRAQNNAVSDAQQAVSNVQQEVAKANAVIDKIVGENRFVDLIEAGKQYQLPIGLKKVINGSEYIIGIESIEIDEKYGYITAYMSFPVPGTDRNLAFKGTDIKFDETGINGVGKLTLLNDQEIYFGSKNVLRFIGTQGKTYANFDCQGFQGFGIQGELEFSRDLIVPADATGATQNQNVKAPFEIQMPDWNSFIVTLSMPQFQLPMLPGYKFTVTEATFDNSDVSNPPSIVFPASYQSDLMPEAGSPLWRGIHIKALNVELPKKQFKSSDNGPTSFSAVDVIIDQIGFSGNLTGRNLLSLDKGRLGGNWAFSVDSIGLSIQSNKIASGGMRGLLQVPILDPKSPLKYNAVIQDGSNYLFQVSNTGTLEVSMWSAKMQLYPNSSLTIQTIDGEFRPKCNLTGKLSIASKGDAGASIADISFTNFQVQTISPVISVEAFTFSSSLQQKMANFPITISEIGMKTEREKIGIQFNVGVNFMGGNTAFGGEAGLIVWGEQSTGSITSWKYKTTELTSIRIDVDGGAFEFHGLLKTYREDPVYGRGMKGMINARFAPGFKVDVVAQFGSLPEYRYWYVDGNLGLPVGILIFPGFGIYGFGGGASYHMARKPPPDISIPTGDNQQNPTDNSSDAGKSLSGVQYIPDQNMGIGLRARIFIGIMPDPTSFNGDVGFEIIFNAGGGVASIRLEGNGYFMSEIYKGTPTTSKAYAGVDASYDFNNKTFHAVIRANVNAEIVRGSGQCVIHFDPEDWYVYIGHPDLDKRIQLEIAGLFNINAYFVVGTNIPGIPDPPAEIGEILGGNYSMKDDLSLIKGGGFGFGARLTIPTKDYTFLMFYANIGAGGGFDINLKNYGSDTRCKGGSGPVGINGWYAMGQVYAYVKADIGIQVDLFMKSGRFSIMDLAVAAILQGKLPNPTWIKGACGGRYRILGGLVSGNCKFEFEVGQKCELMIAGSPLAGIKVISDISPAPNATDIDVFNAPQATFNFDINKEFEMTDANDQNHVYRVKLASFKLLDGTNELPGKLEWNAQNDVVAFNSHDVLPSKKTIKVSVKVQFEEKINGNWSTVIVKGVPAEEVKEQQFESGVAPDHIPHSNIAYSYPILDQFNFYPKESSAGYIQLIKGQSDLFELTSDWKQVGRYIAGSGIKEFSFTYNKDAMRLDFVQPDGLSNESVYNFQFVNVPVRANDAVDKNATASLQTKTDGENETSIKSKALEGTLDLLQEKSIFDAYFRTSKYNTFSEKINGISFSNGWSWPIMPGIHEIGTEMTGTELFDIYEISGKNNIDPLITYEADLTNHWYNDIIKPLVYEGYPVAGITIDWRTENPLGIPPIRAIYLRQIPVHELTESDEKESVLSKPTIFSTVVYNLSYYVFRDYDNLKQKAANSSLRGSNAWINNLITSFYPSISSGAYKVRMLYHLPGTNLTTSFKDINFNRP